MNSDCSSKFYKGKQLITGLKSHNSCVLFSSTHNDSQKADFYDMA